MKKEKIYIAGPMTGIKDFNHPKFLEWEEYLRHEYDVLNPARIDGGSTHKPHEFYMREALKLLCVADKIFLLKGWEKSEGSLKEVLMAEAMGLRFILEESPCAAMKARYFMVTRWPRYVDRESLSSHINKIEKEYYDGFKQQSEYTEDPVSEMDAVERGLIRPQQEASKPNNHPGVTTVREEIRRNKEAAAAERKHMAEFYETVAHAYGDKTEQIHFALATDPAERKRIPVYSGFVNYFPLAMAAVAKLSYDGNEQHNPGTPLHWDRSKSGDELDALMRHLIEGEWTHVAWRAMANLQKQLEKEQA